MCAPGCARQPPADVPSAIRIGIGAPKGTRGSGAETVIASLSSDPWLTNRPDGRQAERIAKSWEWDSTGTILRLKIRNDVYFHDGTLLTPELGAEALRLTKKNFRREAVSFSTIEAVEPIQPDTIEIRLTAPNSFIVPDLSAVLVVKPGEPLQGTGPFQITGQTEEQVTLAAFPRYYRGHPAMAQVSVTNYPTQRNAWAAMMRGDVDMLYEVSRDAAEFVEAETTVRAYAAPRPYSIPLTFNVRRPVLQNPQVRQAINQALDRATIVRDGMRGRGTPADGPLSPQNWAYSPPATAFTYDPEMARRRLDAAGFPARMDAERAVPIRFGFDCLVFADDTRFDRIALLVQKQLADVGIDMRLVPLSLQDFGGRVSAGDFDAFLWEMSGRSLSRVYEFWRSRDGGMINTGYTAADVVLDKIRAARTEEETRLAVAELGRVLYDDPPAAFLAWQETSRAVVTKFDVAAEDKRDILTNLWLWRPASGQVQAAR